MAEPQVIQDDKLSGEDLAALTEAYRHMRDSGDARAPKVAAYIQNIVRTGNHEPMDAANPDHAGFFRTAGDLIGNLAKSAPAMFETPGINPGTGELTTGAAGRSQANTGEMAQADAERKARGETRSYRARAIAAQTVGVNVPEMEKAAREGDIGAVAAHAAVPATIAAAPVVSEGLGRVARMPAVQELMQATKNTIAPASSEVKPLATAPIRYAARATESAVNQKLVPFKPLLKINTPADAAEAIHVKIPGRDIGLPKPSQAEGLPEVEAARPEATATLRARIATERNLRNQEPFPRVSEGLPEVEAGQSDATNLLRKAVAPNPPGPRIATSPKRVGTLLNESVGAKPLNPKVPLRNQLDNVTPVQPKESSVVKSHTYDPNAQEMTVHTHNGGGYIHGDVTPEQAQAFESAESKGKAWNQLKNNSTLVAKIVNGKRVPIAPTGPRVATPDDLTPVLEDSVKAVKARKSFGKK